MPVKRKHTRMPPLDVVLADFKAGMTNEKMSEKYDVVISAISAFLTRNGLSRKKKVFLPADADIIECLNLGWNSKQIAGQFGGKPDAISRHIRITGLRDGITPPPAPAPVVERKGLRPTAFKVINDRGVSIPRIASIHGQYEARP